MEWKEFFLTNFTWTFLNSYNSSKLEAINGNAFMNFGLFEGGTWFQRFSFDIRSKFCP